MKGRACKYTVLKEIAVPEELKNTPVYTDNYDDESDDEFGDGWADDTFEEEQEDDSEEDELRAAAKDELLKVMSEESAEELLDLVERMAASLK
jgi:midasin (ATPase involved in ribosome maturation)